jgi:hypothetical protein
MKLNKAAAVLALSLPFIINGCSDKREGHHTDEKKVQEISCVNNLKQIGLAFRIWSGDHGDKYPFQISTNSGGTWELVSPDKDGFDSNAFLYLRGMNGDDELRTPLLLICPQDKSKRVSGSWTNLLAQNVTYQFRFGSNLAPNAAHEILVICPIDGNVLYCDGTVIEKNAKPDTKTKPVIFDMMKKQIDGQQTK